MSGYIIAGYSLIFAQTITFIVMCNSEYNSGFATINGILCACAITMFTVGSCVNKTKADGN